jgi:hypothetical protein
MTLLRRFFGEQDVSALLFGRQLRLIRAATGIPHQEPAACVGCNRILVETEHRAPHTLLVVILPLSFYPKMRQ